MLALFRISFLPPRLFSFAFGQLNKVHAYKILGVNEFSNHEDIKKAYLRLSKRFHPDINKDPEAQEHFKEINLAYRSLKDMMSSFEEGGQSFTVKQTRYNRYDGKISKEDFITFKKYMKEKNLQDEVSMEKAEFDKMEQEWQKNQEQIFYEIFGKTYQEAPDMIWDEKNQNLREIYDEEIEKLFKKKFADKLDSIEKKIKDKIDEQAARKAPKSRDRLKIREQISKFLRK